MSDNIESLRAAISESYDEPHMVGTFVVMAEVVDEDGEPTLLTWWDGGTQWSRLGMMEWFAQRIRNEIDEGEPT